MRVKRKESGHFEADSLGGRGRLWPGEQKENRKDRFPEMIQEEGKMNIIAAILFGVYGVIGGVSTVVCTVSIPSIIIWKFYRKAKYHKGLMD